jgi:hypothetical protein
LLGIVLGAVLTGIAVAAAESMDHNVRASKDLVLPSGMPLLASIPFIENRGDKRRRALVFTSYAAAYSIAAGVAIAVIISSLHR